MPRSLWSGTLSFGLVTVPVRLVPAVRDRGPTFHQLHAPDGARIEVRRFCAQEEREVPYEELAHGFDLEDGRQVVLTDEELGGVAPEQTRTIDVEAFVELAAIDPVYLDHPYVLLPAGENEGTLRAYQLLVDVIARTGRAALGRFVLRSRQSLVVVREREGLLALSTLRFHDEVRAPEEVLGDGATAGGDAPGGEEVDRAVRVVEALAAPFRPERLRDSRRERLEDVIARKQAGATVRAAPAEEEPEPAADLMAALQRTLADIRARERQEA
jgi:DNA end-binding protein Ku